MTIPTSTPHNASLPPSSPPEADITPSPVTPQPLGPDTPKETPHIGSSTMARSTATANGYVQSSRSGSTSPTKGKAQAKVQLEDFELIRVLGRGCAGRVLLVRHSAQNSIHAMKAISKRSVLASDELPHILIELDILKRLATSKPTSTFVTRLNYSFTDRENFYFVMDFYPGGDLATQLEMYGTLGHMRTRFYAADLVMGLEDLHRQGVILRDLKPENILLNAAGHCVLADFGLSKEFPYRGEPEPLQVPHYAGEMVLPHWAGQGMGSTRLSPGGRSRVVVDRAWSFVGTTEYLAPEVVKGQDYSYAVDWWALGCILFECLIGRVPFRTDDEEPAQMLYNRICCEPWDWMLHEPRYRRKRESELDAVTEDFLEALLQKDPMRRITEPCVRSHFYFTNIDWDLVRSGEYGDPHPLQLHPLAEYNTRYFPKLCLEQDPNVDMSTHNPEEMDEGPAGKGRKLTALNDENTFKFEQLKYRSELEGFYWCREEGTGGDEEVIEEDMEEGEMDDGEMDESEEESGTASESYGSSSSMSELAEPINEDEAASIESTEVDEEEVREEDVEMAVDEDITVKVDETQPTPAPPATKTPKLVPVPHSGAMSSMQLGPPVDEEGARDGDVEMEVEEGITVKVNGAQPAPAPPVTSTPKLAPLPIDGAMSSIQLSTPAASPERLITPDTSDGDMAVHIRGESASPEKLGLDGPAPRIPIDKAEATSLSAVPPPSIPLPAPTSPIPTPVVPVEVPITIRDQSSAPKSIPIPLLRPKPDALPRFPSGLPASGLSVSDIVSIPSPGHDGPRLVRRHPQIETLESSAPAARLSIDLNGTITQLGEDDWEALEGDGTIPSAPNGYAGPVPPSSFLNRLRRRPSNLITSGLGRKRGSDSSKEGSPTKGSVAMFGTTKKALGRLKAFPLLRSRQNSDAHPTLPAGRTDAVGAGQGMVGEYSSSSLLSASASPSSRKSSPRLRLSRPEAVTRRHTESGWFERKLSKSGRYLKGGASGDKRSSTMSSTESCTDGMGGGVGWGSASEGNVTGLKKAEVGDEQMLAGPPRVELKEMGSPVDWEFRSPAVGKGGKLVQEDGRVD